MKKNEIKFTIAYIRQAALVVASAFICFVASFYLKNNGKFRNNLWYFSNDRNKLSEWKYTRNKLFIKNNGLIHYFFGSPGYI